MTNTYLTRLYLGIPLLATFSNIADFGNSLDGLSLTMFVEGDDAIATLLFGQSLGIVDSYKVVEGKLSLLYISTPRVETLEDLT